MQNGQENTDKNQVVSLQQYKELQAENLYLKQELAQLKRMIFGSKSERFIPADTGQLSLEMDIPEQTQPEVETEELSYTRNKPSKEKESPVRMPLPSHLPRKEHIIEPEVSTEGAKKIGEEITEILEYTPGKFHVEKYIRPKYAFPKEEGIVIGELPSLPIPKGNAGPGLLSHLMISKYVDHLPFYRQVKQFKRENITIAESTINGWFSAACRLLEPLYDQLKKQVLQTNYLMADETPIPVLTKDKPGSTHKGYHWVYYAPKEKRVCFDYRSGRGREGPLEFLDGFHGALQTDGYAAYNKFENIDITLLACLAHARRKFDTAKDNDPKRAEYALNKFQELYHIERQARDEQFSPAQRKELRQKESVPILTELEAWMRNELIKVLPKSAIGKAIAYTLKLWNRLSRYVDDGNWEIDNNLIENSIRPVALGRKNYMFAGSHDGAQRAAMMYSFLGTCKINEVEPNAWLKDVLTRIQDHSIQKLEELLPGYQG